MADDAPESNETPPRPAGQAPATQAPPGPRRRWKWPLILLGTFIGLPALVIAIWSWIALSWTYSQGDRAGYVQKFSRKGWVCKTWEGELSMVNIPGAAQERWEFSVRDDSVARVITDLMGNKVSLTYEEKRGIPSSCFGETNYFVSGVRRIP